MSDPGRTFRVKLTHREIALLVLAAAPRAVDLVVRDPAKRRDEILQLRALVQKLDLATRGPFAGVLCWLLGHRFKFDLEGIAHCQRCKRVAIEGHDS